MELIAYTVLFLGVAIAGGMGAVLRLFLSKYVGVLPWGILIANVIASFVVGYAQTSMQVGLAVITISGLAGGLSTFSSYASQTVEYFRRGRLAQGLLNTAATLVLSSTAVWLGALVGSGLLK